MKSIVDYINESEYSEFVDKWDVERSENEPLYVLSKNIKQVAGNNIRTLFDHSVMINNYDLISIAGPVRKSVSFDNYKLPKNVKTLVGHIIDGGDNEYFIKFDNEKLSFSFYDAADFLNEDKLKLFVLNAIQNELSDKLPLVLKKFKDDIIVIAYESDNKFIGEHILVKEETGVDKPTEKYLSDSFINFA